MKKKIAYISFTAVITVAAFFIGRNTGLTAETVPETCSDYVNVADIVDWNIAGEELAVFTSDGYEYYAYKSENIYNSDYLDMSQIVDFVATEDGLQLYTADRNGYYWSVGE